VNQPLKLVNRFAVKVLIGGVLVWVACQSQSQNPDDPTAVPPLEGAAQIPGIHEQLLSSYQLRYTISIPEDYSGKDPVPLVLALHYGGPVTPYYGKEFLVSLIEPALRELGAIILAPDSAAGDWANPQSEKNIVSLLDAIEATYNIDTSRTLITGYSMGGMGTWYLGARLQDRFTAALPMAGMPQDDSIDFRWNIPIYVIHSLQDELIPLEPTENLISQLKDKGTKVQLVLVENITHYETFRYVEPLKSAIPWIKEAWK